MHKILNYQIEKEIYHSANSTLYLAKKEVVDNGNIGQKFVLKQLRKEFPTPEEIARFKREFEITRSLQEEGIIKVYELLKYQNTYIIVLEYFEGDSIANFLSSNTFAVNEVLPIAISIAESLGNVHKNKIIHKDINPFNIVWNLKTGKVKIIDFGISSELSHETTSLQNLNVLEGTLNYMSPEQTGRMNRSVDYRTDLYSLGATLYHMLTGQVPFIGHDAMEIVHSHIAKDPTPPHELNKKIPEILSKIILRLMAKTAEKRYQSASGLVYDLKWCLENIIVETHSRASLRNQSDLQIGANDISDKFEIPQKLYGREKEVETLMNAFDRIKNNTKEIILISGYSGIGKSSIVKEIYKPIVQKKGIFINGKFDQYKRKIPYVSLIQAFQELVKQILTESKEELAVRKETILNALGQNASVITDVIPEVELIIGKQPSARVLSPEESRNRFNVMFRNFVRVFASGKNPLVIFLDDLHWTDLPTLQLLELIITDTEIFNLLIVGAYRDNEVEPTHPLLATLEEIKNKKVTVNTITLSPLNLTHCKQIISETLLISDEESAPLAKLCFEKTQGNPFFLNQFLSTLYQEKFISFDLSNKKWNWNIKEIQSKQITDNVVDLMANRIRKLPDITQNVLRLSACIGNQFDLRTLATVNEKSLSRTAVELWDALKEGFIIPLTETYKLIGHNSDNVEIDSIIPQYRFLHDRVQQAAYSLIAEEERKKVHLGVGRLLLIKMSDELQEENLFDIVNHLNLGKDLISDKNEKERLIELNLSVAKKAKLSAAFEPAFSYAQNAISLLIEDSWVSQFDLTKKVYMEATETAYLSGHFERMENLLETILAKEIPLIDQAKIYEIKILSAIAQHDMTLAIKIALQILKILGIELSQNPSQEIIGKGLGEIMQALAAYKISDLLELPTMTNIENIAAMRIMKLIFSCCYQVDPGLFPILVFTMLQLSLKYGNTSTSAIAYSCYGLVLCGIVGDIDSGYQFGQLALNLIDRFKAEEYKPYTVYTVNVFVRHWKEPGVNTIKPLLEVNQLGMVVGDFEFASHAGWMYNAHSYFAGHELPKVIKETIKYRLAIREIKQESAFRFISIFLQSLLNLANITLEPWKLIGDAYDEDKMLPIHEKANDNTGFCTIYFHKLVLSFLMEEYDTALKFSELTERYLAGLPASQYIPLYFFYDSLTQIAKYPQAESKEAILAKVTSNQTKIKAWADHCPSNCLHKFYLVEAEKSRILGEDLRAIDYYDKAAKLAKENEFLQEEALANELYARFWLQKDKEEFGQILLNKAYHLYRLWGAGNKVNQLENKYGHLLAKKVKTNFSKILIKDSINSTLDSSSNNLDLVSVMKASQSISQEIVIEELLKNMMHIVIENAGAQNGYLLQEKNENWVIEAEGKSDQKKVTVLQSMPVRSIETGILKVPLSIIQYVARTRESVVIENATQDNNYILDPYFTHNNPKSVLSSPILHHGKILGILYLENNAISGVFTRERLEVLQLLSSQVAISLENATLYASLEDKVAQRTKQLEQAHEKILVLEKETTEKQLAGGFAHEMRNALVGPKLVIQHVLGQDGSAPFESLSLANSRKLKEIYLLIKDKIPEDTLNSVLREMKVIFENEEQMENSLNMIYKSVSKGLLITQQIMDYAKVGNEQVGKSEVDINHLLESLVEDYEKNWTEHKIKISLNQPNEKVILQGLDSHFESVFKNLLLNAKDALIDKNITDTREKRINIKAEKTGYNYIVEVTDNGIGISPEHIGRIYDAFFSTKPDSGTGLGLGVVKKIVTLYNGKIEVSSELGKGTTFTATIPIGGKL